MLVKRRERGKASGFDRKEQTQGQFSATVFRVVEKKKKEYGRNKFFVKLAFVFYFFRTVKICVFSVITDSEKTDSGVNFRHLSVYTENTEAYTVLIHVSRRFRCLQSGHGVLPSKRVEGRISEH